MPRQINYGGRVQSFPDDATDEEISAALEAAEAESGPAVPATPLPEAPFSRTSGDTFVKGFGRGALRALDPRPLVTMAGEFLNDPGHLKLGEAAINVVRGLPDAARGFVADLTSADAARSGEAAGSAAASLIPYTGAVKRLGLAERIASALGANRASRVRNIVRAVSGDQETVPAVKALESQIDLPVAGTTRGLESKLAGQIEAEKPVLAAAKANLTGDIPEQQILSRIEEPGIPIVVRGPGGRMQRTVATGDPQKRAAILRRKMEIARITRGRRGSIPAQVAQTMKEEAQDAAERGGAYRKRLPGDTVSPGAEASAAEASAFKAAIEGMGTPESEALRLSNERMHTLATLHTPIARRVAKMDTQPAISRFTEATAGRALLGPALAGVAGYTVAASPMGALGGVALFKFLQSPAWQTLSAAAKRRLIPHLERGDLSTFQNETMKAITAASLTSRLEKAQRDKTARKMRAIE